MKYKLSLKSNYKYKYKYKYRKYKKYNKLIDIWCPSKQDA